MSRPNAKVTIEVTERELRYIMDATGYPYGGFPQLKSKLGDAAQAMREARKTISREAKIARNKAREAATA
jgi:hypothetical protein